jgi:hypothetical protein
MKNLHTTHEENNINSSTHTKTKRFDRNRPKKTGGATNHRITNTLQKCQLNLETNTPTTNPSWILKIQTQKPPPILR